MSLSYVDPPMILVVNDAIDVLLRLRRGKRGSHDILERQRNDVCMKRKGKVSHSRFDERVYSSGGTMEIAQSRKDRR